MKKIQWRKWRRRRRKGIIDTWLHLLNLTTALYSCFSIIELIVFEINNVIRSIHCHCHNPIVRRTPKRIDASLHTIHVLFQHHTLPAVQIEAMSHSCLFVVDPPSTTYLTCSTKRWTYVHSVSRSHASVYKYKIVVQSIVANHPTAWYHQKRSCHSSNRNRNDT